MVKNFIAINFWLIMLILLSRPAFSQTMQTLQVTAFLPFITDIKPGEVEPIDGLWKISTIDKLVRIDRGRIYAVESWNHLMILKIYPGMVVIHPFKQESAGVYTGDDLPLQGPLTAVLTGDRILDVTVKGLLGELKYQLIPQEIDDPAAFTALMEEIRFIGQQ